MDFSLATSFQVRGRTTLAACIFLFFSTLPLISAPASAPQYPLIKYVQGNVHFGKSAGEGDLVKEGAVVPIGGQITTGPGELAAIVWEPGVESVLFENSSVTYITLEQDGRHANLDLVLSTGTLYSRSGDGTHLVILTRPGRIVDHGATFSAKLGNVDSLEVGVASGALEIKAKTPLILTAGNQAALSGQDGHSQVSDMAQEAQDKLIQTLAKYFGDSGAPTGNERIGH